MQSEAEFQKLIEERLSNLEIGSNPSNLYEPIRYMISLGGKRLRPLLTILCNQLFDGNFEDVINPALGIEIFHNFTLLHDDIMDNAPLRRSHETVHTKWNSNIAILSGDSMFVIACSLMMKVKTEYVKEVMDCFLQTAQKVCEGQQYDMDFENQNGITIEDYMNMNSMKTASLLGCSCYIGAICSSASKEDAQHLYEFGKHLGIAFQLQDDILDVYGEKNKFGKQVGGDILSNKKTFLLLTAFNESDNQTKSELLKWTNSTDFNPEKKIEAVVAIYQQLGIKEKAIEKKNYFMNCALAELEKVNVSSKRKKDLLEFAERLMKRER